MAHLPVQKPGLCSSPFTKPNLMFKHLVCCFLLVVMHRTAIAQTAPLWSFALSIGGTAADFANDLATDASGNVYVIGTFSAPQLEVGLLTAPSRGGTDIFVAKFTPEGSPVWLKTLGSVADDAGFAIACDGTDVYATGTYKNALFYNSANFIPVTGLANYPNIVVFKLSGADGSLIWGNHSGGVGFLAGNLIPRDLILSNTGAVFVGGTVDGEVKWGTNATGFSVQDTCYGCGFISAWGVNTGTYAWTYAVKNPPGLSYSNSIRALGLDANNNIYAIGNFRSLTSGTAAQAIFPNLPLYAVGSPGSTTLTGLGNQDFFLLRTGGDGLFQYVKSGGSSAPGSFTDGNTLWVDSVNEKIYLGGAFRDAYFYSGSAAGSVNVPGGNAFLIQTDLNGNEIWERHTTTSSVSGGASVNFLSGNGTGGVYAALAVQAAIDWYGQTASGNTSDYSQAMIVRMQADGTTAWTKVIDGGQFQFVNPPALHAVSGPGGEACWAAGSHSGNGISFDGFLVQGNGFSPDGFVAKLGGSIPFSLTPEGPISSFQVMPNPCRAAMSFSLDLQSDGLTSVELVDLQGRTIAQVLQTTTLAPGPHTFSWRPESPLSPGTYLLRAHSEGQSASRLVVWME